MITAARWRTSWGGRGNQALDSGLMRAILVCVQQAALQHRSVSGKDIAAALDVSNNVVMRYLRALRESGHVGFEDNLTGTIHVEEWL